MIQVSVYKDAEDCVRNISVLGHAKDSAVCASVSMAVAISRKLLGGLRIDYSEGGKYSVEVPPVVSAQEVARAILESLSNVAAHSPYLAVDEFLDS